MELCTPLRICTTHIILQTAKFNIYVVYSIFYVGFSTNNLIYGLGYCAYYPQLAAAAVLLPVATLCYLVTFYTFRAAIERVLLLYVDVMAIVYYI